jgi:tetratricopeptide (TPR) repeat protein
MNLLRLLVLMIALAACAVRAAAPPLVLIERSKAAIRTDPESSRRLAQEALQALTAAPDPDLQIRAHLLLCDFYSERDRESAQREIDRARALLPQGKRPGLRAGLLSCAGEMAEVAGDNVQAMALYQQAVTVAESAGEQEMLADALFQRGYLRGLQGGFANGLADLGQAIGVYERLGLPQQAQTSVNGVAILYNRMGDYRQARSYFEAALKTQKAAGLTRELIVTHHNLGRVLENLKEWDAAQRAFETVLALSRELGYPRGESYALRGLASVRNARAPADALTLLDRAAQLQQSTPDERLRAQILLQRGIALRAQQRPAESVSILQQALLVFTKADSMAELGATHDELARSLTALGKSAASASQVRAIRDSLLQSSSTSGSRREGEFDTAPRTRRTRCCSGRRTRRCAHSRRRSVRTGCRLPCSDSSCCSPSCWRRSPGGSAARARRCTRWR